MLSCSFVGEPDKPDAALLDHCVLDIAAGGEEVAELLPVEVVRKVAHHHRVVLLTVGGRGLGRSGVS